jgi:regulator of sigma E protease
MTGKKISVVELRLPFIVSGIEDKSPNKSAVQEKDIITNFNGVPVQYADEIVAAVKDIKGKTIPAIVKRDGKVIAVSIVVNDSSKMGIQYAARLPYDNLEKLGLYPIRKQSYGFFESFPVGIQRGKDQLVGYGKQLQMIFNPSTGAYKGVGGFKAIFDIFPSSWSWEAFWSITALLSIMLGVMNLLPIPALDGGHVMFLLYEIISRKKPSDKFMENAQMVGFVLLISLLLFANGNDIYKAIIGK